ncbi:MAG: hypothetical protein MJZ24_07935 [Paludibacteraceae bacterium]|nr:hypothetical protein [Paludibacteraceae bacterium]
MKNNFFSFICAFFLLVLGAPSLAGTLTYKELDRIADLRSEAIVAYRDKDFQKAANAYNQAIATGDSSMVPYYNLACCYGRMGKKDSCLAALTMAVDRGYIDHLAMGFDKDLNILHSMPEWSELWMKVYQNAYGKIKPKDFERRMKDGIARCYRNKLIRLFENASAIDSAVVQSALEKAQPYLAFSHLQNADSLYQFVELAKKDTRYENHHFVFYSTLAFPLPVVAEFLDPDVARLMATDTLYASYRNIDQAYMWLDNMDFKSSCRPLSELRSQVALTDSLIVLGLTVREDEINESQDIVAKSNPVVDLVKAIVMNESKTSEVLSPRPNAASLKEDIYFVRLSNIPVKKDFSGIKLAFRGNSDLAMLVVGNHYCYIQSSLIKTKLQKLLRKQISAK